jgi:hypothetical protein
MRMVVTLVDLPCVARAWTDRDLRVERSEQRVIKGYRLAVACWCRTVRRRIGPLSRPAGDVPPKRLKPAVRPIRGRLGRAGRDRLVLEDSLLIAIAIATLVWVGWRTQNIGFFDVEPGDDERALHDL